MNIYIIKNNFEIYHIIQAEIYKNDEDTVIYLIVCII